ncbi:MAG: hypothetical protein K8953_08895, partial [Proteobacteria bacterium]|nr:hypothetical protein [Pseudomonadota bacterium]
SGAVFWVGFIRDDAAGVQATANVHLYAGLLPGTDVGLPLPQGTGARHNGEPTATWNGTISASFLGSGFDMIGEGTIAELTRDAKRLTDTGFQLLIDFGAGTIKTPAQKKFLGNFKLSLDGTFDGGIMAGAVALAPTQSALMTRGAGRFSGLIGADGAVGVFKSDNDDTASNGYIGGFVAAPPPPPPYSTVPVRSSTWTDSFSGTPSTNTAGDVLWAENGIAPTNGANNSTHFITGGANGIGVINQTINRNNATPRFLRLDGTTGGSGDSSGVVFWAGRVKNGPATDHFYAGLLSGTDVGLRLPHGAGATFQGASTATWHGTIRGLFTGSGDTDFAAGSISGFTKTGSILMDTNFRLLVNYGTGALTTPLGKESFGTINFSLDGSFDENGVMTGDYTAEAGRPAGRFGGIIGTTGAVGVFKSNGRVNSIVGGFVAKPPGG